MKATGCLYRDGVWSICAYPFKNNGPITMRHDVMLTPTPPPPGLLRTGHLPTPGPFPSFHTHAASSQNKTTQQVLMKKKKADWLTCLQLKRVVKACSRFYTCISSLLIKPELHREIGAIDVSQRFLVIESNFC